jgi:hypothetical protein
MLFYVMQSPYIEDPWYNNNYTEKFACITTYGDRIYSITLPYPYPQPIGSAGVAPLCSSFFREFGPDFLKRYQWRKAPTTGAYDIDVDGGLIKGQRIIMHRVKDWWARDRRHYRYRYNADYIVFNVINNASGTRATQTQRGDANGNRIIDVMLEQIDAAMADNISRGNGKTPAALESRYGLNRAAGGY